MSKSFRLFSFIFLGVVGICNSQTNDSITLPNGNIDMKIFGPTLILEIYITSDQRVYFGNERLSYFDEICSLLKNKYRDPTIRKDKKVAIVADKDLNYSFVDRIKEQIGCVGDTRIYYKTGNLNDLTYQYNILNGSTLRSRESERIPMLEQEIQLNGNLSKMDNLPPPPKEFDYYVLMRELHNGSREVIDKWLQKYSFTSIWLLGEGKFLYRDKIYDYNNEKALEEIILNSENLFIRYREGLTYGDYVSFIQIKNRLAIENKINLSKKMIGEISLEAEERFKDLGIIIK